MSNAFTSNKRPGTAILIVLLVLAIVGLGGWVVYLYHHKSSTNAPTLTSSNSNSSTTAQTRPASTTSTSPNTPAPILGIAWGNSQQGYGTVKPTTISNGGDPTGIVQNVTWQSWGGAQATGQGTTTYIPAGEPVSSGTQEQATVVAFNLGTCQGKFAYMAIEWYFPQHGGVFNPNVYTNICTGTYVGQ